MLWFKVLETFRWVAGVAVATLVNYLVFSSEFPDSDWVVYPFTVTLLVLANVPLLVLIVEAIRNAVTIEKQDKRRR